MNTFTKILGILVICSSCLTFVVGYKKLAYEKPVVRRTIPPRQIPQEPQPQTPEKHTLKDAIDSVTAKEIKEDVTYLASDELEGRMSGKKGNVEAARYIETEMKKLGLSTMYDKFNVRRMNPGPNNEQGDDFTQNVYAWIDGNEVATKDEIVVIGAHFDHIGYGPQMSMSRSVAIHNGADDNASGTAAVMEIAEAFAMLKDQVKRTIVFQFYSAEEMGLIGSRHYCENPKFPKSNPSMGKHIAMLNLDMIGNLNRKVSLEARDSITNPNTLQKFIDELNGRYQLTRYVIRSGRNAGGGSDHMNFYNKGVPIVFFHTGTNGPYHRPEDDADLLNYEGCEDITKYAFELAWMMCQSEEKIKIEYAGFKFIESFHDHDVPELPFVEPQGYIR